MTDRQERPEIPEARRLALPGRGTTTYREIAGPPGAPTLLLLHGLGATGGLNWIRSFGALADAYRIITIDHRGHGGGIRTTEAFRLADCADDAAALADTLGIDRLIAVGYSMGGPITQLLWHRHHDLVAGMVLCATSRSFMRRNLQGPLRPVLGPGFKTVALATAPGGLGVRLRDRALSRIRDPQGREFVSAELRGHQRDRVAEATAAVLRFASQSWIGNVDVPAAVVVTTKDQLVPPSRQYGLAAAIPGATMYEVEADHFSAPMSRRFAATLRQACDDVAARAELSSPAATSTPTPT